MSNCRFQNELIHFGFFANLSLVTQRPFTELIEYIGYKTPMSAIQICLPDKSNVQDLVLASREISKHHLVVFVHACFTHNLFKEHLFPKTLSVLVQELDITVMFGGKGVVVHPGSFDYSSKSSEIAAKHIEMILSKGTTATSSFSDILKIKPSEFKKKRRLLLENSAQEGKKRGGTLEELAEILSKIDKKYIDQVGICFDTAHAYGAGIYDLGKEDQIEKFFSDFDRIVGLEKLWLVHLNDSRRSTQKISNAYFGSRKDRHQNLCHGWIWGEDTSEKESVCSVHPKHKALRRFLELGFSYNIPIICETPDYPVTRTQEWKFVGRLMKDSKTPLFDE